MKWFSFNLLKTQPAPESQKDYSENILSWGATNSKPVQIIDTVNASITGEACINTIRKYIYGAGLTVDSEFKVSQNLTAYELHRHLSQQLARLRGVAIHVSYNMEGKISLRKMPFESCRLGIPDDNGIIRKIYYNPYFGLSDYNMDDTVEYDVYDPDLVTEQVQRAGGWSNYKGQIYWKAITSEFNEFYPLPEWFGNNNGKGGGKKWMEIERLIGDFHSRNISSGFLQNVLLKMIGDPDQPIPEHKDKAANKERFTSVGEQFEDDMNTIFAGAEGAKLFVLWSKLKDEFPELEPFPANTHHDLFLALQRLSTENILIATQVPPSLAGVKVSGTLSKDDIVNAVKLMWGNVEDEQQFLEHIYNELFPKLIDPPAGKVLIINYSPVSIGVDAEIWEVMTNEEKRTWITENTDIKLNGLQEPINNEE